MHENNCAIVHLGKTGKISILFKHVTKMREENQRCVKIKNSFLEATLT